MKNFVYFLILYFLFSMLYVYIIVSYFSYEGYYADISKEKIVLSILFLFLLSLILEKKEKISVSLINALIGFSIIPMLVLFSFQNLSLEYMLYVIFSVLLVMLICKFKFNFKLVPIKQIYILTPILVVSFFVILILFWENHKYFNLDISKVYEYRRIISDNTPKLVEYIYNILFKGLVPLLFLYYLFHLKDNFTKFVLSLFLLIFYTLIFGMTSHKFFLFIIPFMLLLYFIGNFTRNWNLFFLKFLIILLFNLILLYIILGDSNINLLIISLFLRRVFFVPAMLNFSYFEFFKEHNFVYFTDSKLLPFRYILGYPYDLDISHLIGREMFGKPEMGANTGWLGSGYAQAGFLGMILYAVIISLVLKYLDYVSKYLRKEFIILSFIPYIVVLYLSSDLKTVFITHGLIFYLIFLGILAFNEKKRRIGFAHKKENMPHFNRSSSF